MKKIFIYLLLAHFFQGFLLAQENANSFNEVVVQNLEGQNQSSDDFNAMLNFAEPAGDIVVTEPQKNQISYVALLVHFMKNGIKASYTAVQSAASQVKKSFNTKG